MSQTDTYQFRNFTWKHEREDKIVGLHAHIIIEILRMDDGSGWACACEAVGLDDYYGDKQIRVDGKDTMELITNAFDAIDKHIEILHEMFTYTSKEDSFTVYNFSNPV